MPFKLLSTFIPFNIHDYVFCQQNIKLMHADLHILDQLNFGKYLHMKVEVESWMYKLSKQLHDL